jgi:phosphate uptake regulator
MNVREHIQAIRAPLLKMSRLSQRAVDYSIKAYELGSKEFCSHVIDSEHDFDELHRCIAFQCRQHLLTRSPFGSDSRFAWSALRICIALDSTYSAAAEIAQNTMFFLEDGHQSCSPALDELGRLVNRLTRLCTVALFEKEVRHAKTVLKNDEVGRWFKLAIYHANDDRTKWIDTQTALELAIAKNFEQIAEQAYEIADAIIFWLEVGDYAGLSLKPAADVVREFSLISRDEEANNRPILAADAYCWSEFWP